eukprot:16036-Heterococcus_DN1.PRE.3
MDTNDAFATLRCCNELLQCLGALLLPHASIMHRETGRVICKQCPSRDVSSNIDIQRESNQDAPAAAFFHNKTHQSCCFQAQFAKLQLRGLQVVLRDHPFASLSRSLYCIY